jgi:hypothetical protein
MTERLPPPFLGTEPLGPTPTAGPDGDHNAPSADDPILSSYDRPAAAPSDAPGLPIGPDEVTAFLVGLGEGLAQLRGPHWQIEPDECAILAPPLARQLAKPDGALAAWLATHADAVLIAFGAGAIVIPRAITEYQVISWRREQAKRQEQEAPGYGFTEYTAPDLAGGGDYPAPDGTGPSLPSGIEAGAAAARPSDPARLAATLRAITGH